MSSKCGLGLSGYLAGKAGVVFLDGIDHKVKVIKWGIHGNHSKGKQALTRIIKPLKCWSKSPASRATLLLMGCRTLIMTQMANLVSEYPRQNACPHRFHQALAG